MERSAHSSRSARLGERQRQRRRRARFAAAGAIALTLASAAAIAIQQNEASAPSADDVDSRSSTSANTPGRNSVPVDIIDKIIKDHPPRKLSNADPLRVWVGGDSLSGGLGLSLGDVLAPTGIVKITVDFKVGSGLHNNDRRNWAREVPQQMAAYDPDVAIFMIGANDTGVVTSRTESWTPDYREKISEIMEKLKGTGDRTVYWVGPPTMKPTNYQRGAKQLSMLMADEAKSHENVVFIDAFAMFDDDEGNYTNRIDMEPLNRKRVLVRIGDGVHFTNDGADWLAYNVAQTLDAQWNITAQAGGKPFKVSIIEGGGSVPGYQPPNRRSTTTRGTSKRESTTTSTSGGSTTTSAGGETTTTAAPTTSTTDTPTTTTAAPPTT